MTGRKLGAKWHRLILACIALLGCSSANAASATLVPEDSNSQIAVENAVVDGSSTKLFFLTWPYMGDPQSGQPCPLNYYIVTLTPGLPQARAEVVAKGVCGSLFQKSRLMASSDAVILAGDKIELWRAGQQIEVGNFSTLDALKGFGISTNNMGSQFFDIAPGGGILITMYAGAGLRQQFPGSSAIATSLTPDGNRRWISGVGDGKDGSSINRIWAGSGGGALLHLNILAGTGIVPEPQDVLVFISPAGNKSSWKLTIPEDRNALANLQNATPEEVQRALKAQKDARPESLKNLQAQPRADGGFDVLFYRTGGDEGREGHFLYRVAPDGTLQSEIALGNEITEHGVQDWRDFMVTRNQLVLYGSVQATQHGIQARRKTYSQGVVSWVDMATGAPFSRLIPLDTRYLEAAMNAGDEDIQNLPGLPGGEPKLLTEVNGTPVAVSVGFIGGRNALRISEATDDLVVWTEVYDQRQARIAKEAREQQNKVDREARQRQMNADLAASVGMTPEEFSALSNRERKEALLRNGDLSALQQMGAQQAQAAQPGVAAPGMQLSAEQQAQMAAQMAKAQEQMANNPNLTPEMRAQMAAAMATLQQSYGGQQAAPTQPGAAAVNPGAGANSAAAPAPEDAIVLDANLRGFVEFESENGVAMTLLITDRQSNKELFKKNYPDGTIYEYIDFSRYGLPLEQISVVFRDAGNAVLSEPPLVVGR